MRRSRQNSRGPPQSDEGAQGQDTAAMETSEYAPVMIDADDSDDDAAAEADVDDGNGSTVGMLVDSDSQALGSAPNSARGLNSNEAASTGQGSKRPPPCLPPVPGSGLGSLLPAALHSSSSSSAAAAAAAAGAASKAPGTTGTEEEDKRRIIILLTSVFENRAPTILFTYTTACGAPQRNMDRSFSTGPDAPKMYYAHTDRVHEYNAVINILRQGGLYRLRPDARRWALLWSNHPPPETLNALVPGQKTNHFPGSFHLGRKDLIWRSLARMRKKHGLAYEITPEVFVFPREMADWDQTRMADDSALWIWKPCSASCGRGIRVLSSNPNSEELADLKRRRGVLQRYIPNPLLIDGYKFDLRIYVVVLSYEPLKVYINHEGLVRIATEKYSNDPKSLSSRTMHLTNYSVNKQSDKFVQNTDGRGSDKETKGGVINEGEESSRAFKWCLAELKEYFKKKGYNYDKMWESICDVVIKTLMAVELPMRACWSQALYQEEEGWAARGECGCHRSSCFEMYGFDILVDEAMKSWLLEVNICPSLSSGSPLDKRIKTQLVADTMTLVGLRPTPGLWTQNREAARKAMGAGVILDPEHKEFGCTINSMTYDELAARAEVLNACRTPQEAVKLFNEAEWDLVLDAHDEEYRCGGLELIFPTERASEYKEFHPADNLTNLVLRKWKEAGGGSLFTCEERNKLLPAHVPRQVSFTRT